MRRRDHEISRKEEAKEKGRECKNKEKKEIREDDKS